MTTPDVPEDVLAALNEVVVLGDAPTPQELALGDAVREHLATRDQGAKVQREESGD